MKLPKIDLSDEKIDVNLKFYFFLKYIIKAKFADNQIYDILEQSQLFSGLQNIQVFQAAILEKLPANNKTNQNKRNILNDIFLEIDSELILSVFLFSLKLYLIKDLLLEEAKVKRASNLEKLKELNPLSLEYDKITVFNPYSARVNGSLLCLAFFESLQAGFVSQQTDDFIHQLVKEAQTLLELGIEPNQIFMLVFNESLNQSITSNSGSDYESRIKSVLLGLGLPASSIQKKHDLADCSTEFDFFFEYNGKIFGISAKRTLREQYKQFIKTAQMSQIDVMIEITLGTDLSKDKVKAIRQHNVYLFVADEIYCSQTYLQSINGVYSCLDLSLDLLDKLAE